MLKPRMLLHVEGAAVLFAAVVAYHELHGSWLWFALLLLVPDVSMLGYAFNLSLGAKIYNLVHSYIAPVVLLAVAWLAGYHTYLWLLMIWLAHIGLDRMLGYGLKYETAFKDTHLQKV